VGELGLPVLPWNQVRTRQQEDSRNQICRFARTGLLNSG
jgi:hypothetical protein